MTIVAFIVSIVLTGIVASLVPVTTGTEEAVNADYHYVPAMGDVFGA